MSNLFQFLTDLAVNPDQQARFEQNPEMVMAAARLAEADKVGLASRDQARVFAAFAGELETNELTAVMGAVCGVDPGPDPSPDPDPPAPPPSR